MISAVCAVPRGACAPQPRAAKGGAADSDAEDDAVRASDAVFLAGRTEDDFSCVEMYVYDDEQGSLYVHHDVRLEAFPLALAFLQHGSAGARVAVGTMEPRIDVWDLDVMEPAAPVASLGGDAPTAAGRKAPRPTPGAHGDAVLSVSWRRHSPPVTCTPLALPCSASLRGHHRASYHNTKKEASSGEFAMLCIRSTLICCSRAKTT